MKVIALTLALLALPDPALATPEPIASAEVVRDGDHWTVDYHLGVRAPVWAFARSDLPRVKRQSWRIDSMKVLTPNVSLQRVGNYDVLVAANGDVPEHVRLSFEPFGEDIETSYDAALIFTEGSVALYSQQFKVVPMRSLAEAKAAPLDSAELPSVMHPTNVTFRDEAGPVLARGARHDAYRIGDEDAYVLFGKTEPDIGKSLTTIADPGLPKWLSDYVRSTMPAILSSYAEKLGPPPLGQPMVIASWAGPAKGQTSMSGSVLPGTVVMAFLGDGLLKQDKAIEAGVRWFVAHESAHFWLGQKVSYETPRDSWITEGGADLLAIRAVAATDPSFDAAKRLSEAKQECLPLLANGGIASANERGDHRAYYACGAIIALSAEQASGGDFASFIRTLIERHGDDGIVTREEWLNLLDERSPGMAAEAAKLLDGPIKDAAASLDAFAAKAGIAKAMQTKAVAH